MCPAHIRDTIAQIKEALRDDSQTTIRVVSTQLIEAGVDIDFPVVYRQEAGLDSILQAAGRCNREGKRGISTTHVFSLTKEHNLPIGQMRAANDARLSLRAGSDWFAPDTMAEYFRQLYCKTDSFDKKGIKNFLYNPRELYFDKGAEAFRLIDNAGIPVLVCWKDSANLVGRLLEDGPSYRLMKKLAQYTVNIYPSEFRKLNELGVVSEKREGLYVVDYQQHYDPHTGLQTDNNWANEVLVL